MKLPWYSRHSAVLEILVNSNYIRYFTFELTEFMSTYPYSIFQMQTCVLCFRCYYYFQRRCIYMKRRDIQNVTQSPSVPIIQRTNYLLIRYFRHIWNGLTLLIDVAINILPYLYFLKTLL